MYSHRRRGVESSTFAYDNSYITLPGAYAFVHFTLQGRTRSVVIPANTMLFRSEGLPLMVPSGLFTSTGTPSTRYR